MNEMTIKKNKTNLTTLIILAGMIIVLFSQIIQLRQYYQRQSVIATPTTKLYMGRGLCRQSVIATPTPIPTPTAWVKQDILVEMPVGRSIWIWTDNPETDMLKVQKIEGVVQATLMNNDRMIAAYIDPRYDKDLVAKAIEKRLKKEENGN